MTTPWPGLVAVALLGAVEAREARTTLAAVASVDRAGMVRAAVLPMVTVLVLAAVGTGVLVVLPHVWSGPVVLVAGLQWLTWAARRETGEVPLRDEAALYDAVRGRGVVGGAVLRAGAETVVVATGVAALAGGRLWWVPALALLLVSGALAPALRGRRPTPRLPERPAKALIAVLLTAQGTAAVTSGRVGVLLASVMCGVGLVVVGAYGRGWVGWTGWVGWVGRTRWTQGTGRTGWARRAGWITRTGRIERSGWTRRAGWNNRTGWARWTGWITRTGWTERSGWARRAGWITRTGWARWTGLAGWVARDPGAARASRIARTAGGSHGLGPARTAHALGPARTAHAVGPAEMARASHAPGATEMARATQAPGATETARASHAPGAAETARAPHPCGPAQPVQGPRPHPNHPHHPAPSHPANPAPRNPHPPPPSPTRLRPR
ncbi:hypothetical protein ABZ896_49255 [Streptomyces sp. NPDC047072]|uniref:hypothetical protein n=1 Tax=Streptomyces sp. NPDC047072 TaxID=3154809 RepID=UPI0033E1C7DE